MTGAIAAGQRATLPASVCNLLAVHGLGELPVRFAAPSATRIDTGGWLRGGQVWAAVVGDRFVLAAAGRRPSLIQLPVGTLSRGVYNHVTGELGFPPGPSGPGITPVRLDPLVARSLLAIAATSPPGTVSHA